jgi:hypothetical protein
MPQVAEDFSRNVVGQISGAALAALFTVLGLVTFHFADVIGWALAGVIWLAEFVYVLWCLGLFLRYVGVLGAGADPPGSRERQAYHPPPLLPEWGIGSRSAGRTSTGSVNGRLRAPPSARDRASASSAVRPTAATGSVSSNTVTVQW